MNLDKLREKIRLLLNKAANTPYPEEAQTFREHAERLMARHGIEQIADASQSAQAEYEPDRLTFHFTGVYRKMWAVGLYQVVAAWPTLAGVATGEFKHQNKNTYGLVVFGSTDQLQLFKTLADSLQEQCLFELRVWWKYAPPTTETRSQAKNERKAFMSGFYGRVGQRFQIHFDEEARAQGVTSTALELFSNKVQTWVDQHLDVTYGKATTVRASQSSRLAGVEAGDRADLLVHKSLDKM